MLKTNRAGAKNNEMVMKYLDDTDFEGWEVGVPIEIFIKTTSLKFTKGDWENPQPPSEHNLLRFEFERFLNGLAHLFRCLGAGEQFLDRVVHNGTNSRR